MRHLMSPLDFSVEELDKLMDLAGDIEAHPEKYAHACAGKKLATLFYEPSTRTRLSTWLFFGSFQLCYQRGKRSRYDPYGFLLCRYLCDQTSKRRCTDGCSAALFNPGDQRR